MEYRIFPRVTLNSGVPVYTQYGGLMDALGYFYFLFYFISEIPVLLPGIIPTSVLCEMLRGRLRFPNISSSDVMLHLAPS